ncbi:MAG TPA: N-acetyl-alpha-D-glucosaminyl L-malate synthase BshA [Candidatus Kapabacteria bacterium]|nr:N-acetyl-alpha-D-glucosaminyl L-malate synthase BshA [Candidatus Kapabacteria bacterium]
MKIGIICYPTYGGSGIVATELGIQLAQRGHQIHFISYAMPMRLDKYMDNVYYHEVDIPHYPLFEFHLYTLALTGKIIEVVKHEELDIIHAHYAIPHAISGILTKNILKDTNIKLLTTLHGTDITLVGLELAFHPLVKYSLENSDGVSAVSNYLKHNTLQHFETSKDIDVIYNFIDTDLYKRVDASKLRKTLAPNNEKLLIHISNFRSVKRVQDTIRILKEVNKDIPTKLLLVGDGPEKSDCEKLSRELGMSENIKFLGKQSMVVELLSASDVFLLPSQSESFGLSALEAMSCGVPVVASNIGGIPEVVSHGKSGYVAEFGDINRMAKYVKDLLSNEKKWKMYSKESRKIAEEKFNKHIIIPQYEQLYERLIHS